MRKLALLILLCGAGALAQTPANMCAVGSVVNTQMANTGQSCTIVTTPAGAYISKLGLTAALSTQTICDTTSTCPAGFFTLFAYVDISTAGTITSAVTANLQYTDNVRSNNVALGAALSLITTTPGSYSYNFYHAANTAVTVTTTTTTLTGSPVYNFWARLVWHGF